MPSSSGWPGMNKTLSPANNFYCHERPPALPLAETLKSQDRGEQIQSISYPLNTLQKACNGF
jgi:hypothetical protein